MAKLIKDDEQVRAFKEINEAIGELRKINERILSNEPVSIAVGSKQTIQLDGKFTDKVVAILKAQRQNVIKDIQQKAKKFRIELDDDEVALMQDKVSVPVTTKVRNEQPKTKADIDVSEIVPEE